MQKENLTKKEINKKIVWDLDTKKEVAKVGMTLSLGVVAGTALFLKNKAVRNLHTISGVALIGFSIWHSVLYDKKKDKKALEK